MLSCLLFFIRPDEDDDKEEFVPEDDQFLQELTLEKAAQMAAGVAVDDDAAFDGSPNCNLVILPHQLPRPVYVPPPPPEAIEPLFETVNGKVKGEFYGLKLMIGSNIVKLRSISVRAIYGGL